MILEAEGEEGGGSQKRGRVEEETKKKKMKMREAIDRTEKWGGRMSGGRHSTEENEVFLVEEDF